MADRLTDEQVALLARHGPATVAELAEEVQRLRGEVAAFRQARTVADRLTDERLAELQERADSGKPFSPIVVGKLLTEIDQLAALLRVEQTSHRDSIERLLAENERLRDDLETKSVVHECCVQAVRLVPNRAELIRRADQLVTEARQANFENPDSPDDMEVAEFDARLDTAVTWNDMVHEVMGEESETDG